ncbi:MAG TPA: nucleotidyltransferase domain-containing protein [Planctomycetota bacterium]|nr:nucleotidyltransferase domain-containing protein [Planctomycetota bacterium]
MHAVVERHRDEIVALCKRYGVVRLDVFGSATGERFDPERSDVDFLVEFEPRPPGEYADAFFGLLESLEDLLQRRVDLVVEPAIRNPYFRRNIERGRETVYST